MRRDIDGKIITEPSLPYVPGPHVHRGRVCGSRSSIRSRRSARQRRSYRDPAHRLHGCHLSDIVRAHCGIVHLHLRYVRSYVVNPQMLTACNIG